MNFIEALKESFGLENKDVFTILLSTIAFTIALVTFIFNVYQKMNDNKRVIRKELTDIIKELVEVNLAWSKMDIEYLDKPQNNFLIEQRRTYNSRRRYLVEHGEFLAKKIPKLVSDIDYVIMGIALIKNGFTEKGISFWMKAIKKAKTTYMRAVNMRGLAGHLFFAERFEDGRKLYEESIAQLDLNTENNTDFNLDAIADTFLMWARSEYNVENFDASDNLANKSKDFSEKIKNGAIRTKAISRIQLSTHLFRTKIELDQQKATSLNTSSASKKMPRTKASLPTAR